MRRNPQALFQHGIELFNSGEFYRCHEVLEELWTPASQPERWFLQSLIHFAVGFFHHQKSNQAGASRQLRKGLRKIRGYLPEWGGVRTGALEQAVRDCLAIIEAGGRIEIYPRIELIRPYRPEKTADIP